MNNINGIETSGASLQTANYDNLGYSGVQASHAMAKMDQGRMQKYKPMIQRVGREKGVDPALIAGIISRESRAGNQLHDGRDYERNALGLMQVDKRSHNPRGGWDSEEHIRQGTEILVDSLGQIQRKFPNWSSKQQVKGALAAYNMGAGNVHSYDGVDANTTGRDYSNDVVARAQWFKGNGF